MEDRINDLEQQIKDLKQELKIQKEKESKWLPAEGDLYYWIDETREPRYRVYNGDMAFDNCTIRCNKIFRTEEEAQRYADYLDFRDEYTYEFTNEEWKDDRIIKYYLFYDYEDDLLDYDEEYTEKYANCVYFKTIEKAKEFINKFEKDILEFEFNVKERRND